MEHYLTSTPTVRKTSTVKRKPTPDQEGQLERVLQQCRALYNCTVEQRSTGWRRGQGRSVSRSQQEAEWPALRAEVPDYAAVPSQVWQDVLARLEKTSQAFFRRLRNGEKPGFPRFHGKAR